MKMKELLERAKWMVSGLSKRAFGGCYECGPHATEHEESCRIATLLRDLDEAIAAYDNASSLSSKEDGP